MHQASKAVERERLFQEVPYAAAAYLRDKEDKSLRELAALADHYFKSGSPDPTLCCYFKN